MTKLPVWATVREAFRATWANFMLLLRFAMVPLVLVVAADLWLQKLTAESGAGMVGLDAPHSGSWSSALPLFAGLLPSLVMITFVAQSYRLFLFGPAAVSGDGLFRIGREFWGLAAVTVLVFAVLNLPLNFMIGYVGFGGFLPSLAAALYAVALIAIGIRLIFVYPVICLGRPWALPSRWRETRGNFLRLLAALAAVALPVWAFIVAVSLFTPPALQHAGLPMLWPIAALLPQVAAGLFLEALIAAVTVIAFATLTGQPAEGLEAPVGPEAPGSRP